MTAPEGLVIAVKNAMNKAIDDCRHFPRCLGCPAKDNMKDCHTRLTAQHLAEQGFGNIKEFAEQLKQRLQEEDKTSERLGLENACEDLGVYSTIDELLKEFLQ